MKLIVGLGNPGTRYEGTRHNIGSMVVERLAGESGVALKKKGHQGIYGVGRVSGEEVTLLLPQTYMNLSGVSVGSAYKSLGLDPGDLIVVHDDVDLPFGRVRIKTGGGHGGHNGIRNIHEVLTTGDFIRVKLGVGRPPGESGAATHVLRGFAPDERKKLERVLTNSTGVLEGLLANGVHQAMNEFNNRDLTTLQ